MSKKVPHTPHTRSPAHGLKREISYLKPPKFRSYYTIKEVAQEVGRDVSRIRILETEGRIPKAVRVTRGSLEIRLWSPAQVEEIREIFAALRPGRPRSDGS
jgi:hypothetical protein